ncbi:collagen-binding domain-containing protein [Lactobacillus kitasatonis]|uniref:collagen-binding domain-containing protein n=1 Tax=Lactobacillus kitasatonis TaxID=237446 RepID=UPI0026ED223F|nr:collagen-binding domain-containing protein [Lactobacillus kitasatonis]
MTKKNLKTLMAGTTTLLLGLNVFASPVQAAADGQSGAALGKEVISDQQGATGTDSTGNSGSEQQASATNDSKAVTEKSGIYEDQTKINNQGTTIGELAKEQHENNALGVAGMFGIFSKKTVIKADTNSNIATKEYVRGNEFGTRSDSQNLSDKDISYIDKIDDMGANAFRTGNNIAVIGDDNDVKKNGNQVFVKGNRLDHLNANDFRKESEINPSKKYIDIDAEFEELEKRSDYFSSQSQTKGVEKNFEDMNNRQIDLSNAVPDKNNAIYVDLDADILQGAQPIKINGLTNIKSPENVKGSPVVIINVRNSGKELTARTQTQIFYGSKQQGVGEGHDYPNHILWNFGNDLSKLTVSSGYMMGSILAPNAEVVAGVNIDGNIVADTVNILGGENHRWDLHPGDSFVQITPGQDNHKKPDEDKPGKDDHNKDDHDKKPDEDKPGKDDHNKDDHKKPDEDKPGKDDHNKDDHDKKPDEDKPGKDDHNKDDHKKPDEDKPGKDDHNDPQNDNPSTLDDNTKPNDEVPPIPFEPAYPAIPGDNNPTPEQLETPSFSEPKSKTPFSDAGTQPIKSSDDDVETFFKAQAKAHIATNKNVNRKTVKQEAAGKAETPVKTVTTLTTPKTSVEENSVSAKDTAKVVAPKAEKATSLPQTGQKQNNFALLGLALSATALVIGFIGKAKKD